MVCYCVSGFEALPFSRWPRTASKPAFQCELALVCDILRRSNRIFVRKIPLFAYSVGDSPKPFLIGSQQNDVLAVFKADKVWEYPQMDVVRGSSLRATFGLMRAAPRV